jgi:transposase-like protein
MPSKTTKRHCVLASDTLVYDLRYRFHLSNVIRIDDERVGKGAELVETAVDETLVYYAFPEEHWRRIRTNNPLGHIMREIRRRTRVVGAFPDGNSALNLATARLRHIAGTRWSTKRYLNMGLLKQGALTMQTA